MKVIICGAGMVGSTIAKYLASENNDVTVIDNSTDLIDTLSDTLDVQPVLGHASQPSILEEAGAEHADMLIAVTQSDEVNMVACQVAHSLFNIPIKIARVRSQDYLEPMWSNLYTQENLPIDVIISPEAEMAKAVLRRLRVPEAIDVIPMVGDLVSLIGVRCPDICPVVNTTLRQLTSLFPDLNVRIVSIIRNDKVIVPSSNDQMMPDDEVYFVVDNKHLERAMMAFGVEREQAHRIIIFGGGDIGLFLAEGLEQDSSISCKIIERDKTRAEEIASVLSSDTTVISGDVLDIDILNEAGIDSTETVIAVTNDDEANLLSSLFAKKHGVERTLTLVNNRGYHSLIRELGVDAVIDPRAITISTILRKIRKGRIHSAHTINDGVGEVMEAEVVERSDLVGSMLKELKIPKGVVFGAIVRADEVLIPTGETELKAKDRVVLFATAEAVKDVEKLFAVGLEYF
jgi:trk system potassium uptake protein TrkA